MMTRGEGVNNLKKMMTSFMNGPYKNQIDSKFDRQTYHKHFTSGWYLYRTLLKDASLTRIKFWS